MNGPNSARNRSSVASRLGLPPEKASINLASIPNQYNELPHLASIGGQKTTSFQRIPFPFNGSIGNDLFRRQCIRNSPFLERPLSNRTNRRCQLAGTPCINTSTDMPYLPWFPPEVNNVVFLLSGAPSATLYVPTLRLGEREQNALCRRPSRFPRPLRSSLCHKPVPKAASRASWLPNHRKCPRASITAMAQVYRVAKAVRSGPL